jgi:hypothetical protein
LRNGRAFCVIKIGLNCALWQRCGSGNHIASAQWTKTTRHWFAFNGTLDNAPTAIRLGLWERWQFAHTVCLYIARLGNASGLHVARLTNRLSDRSRLGVYQLAVRIRGEARLIGVHGLGHTNRPALQKRNSSDRRRELS